MQRHYPLNPATGLEDASLLPWTNGNPTTGQEGSYPPFGLFTDPQDEIVNAIQASGQTLSSDKTQLAQAIRSGGGGWTDTGSANALVISPTPAITSYAIFQRWTVKAANANTTEAVTININGVGARNVKRMGGSALAIGDIQAGAILQLADDGTQLQLLNVSQSKSGQFVLAKKISVPADVAAVIFAVPSGFDFFRVTSFMRSSNQPINARLCIDGSGTVFRSGATDYSVGYATVNGATSWSVSSGANQTSMQWADVFDNDTYGFSVTNATLHIGGPALYPQLFGTGFGILASVGLKSDLFESRGNFFGPVTHIQVFATSGNIKAGSFITIEGMVP